MPHREFKVNDYITLKLENGRTNIYVKGKVFQHCKYLAFNIPIKNIQQYNTINSIDNMEEIDRSSEFRQLEIGPEEEFWGHCSNLQAWTEHDYDTRLLHSNIAFPLLKKLVEAGDSRARKAYKDEIALRIKEGNLNVIKFLASRNYLKAFTEEELDVLYSLFENKFILWGIMHDAPPDFYHHMEKLENDEKLAKLGVKNKAPKYFYWYFEKLMKDKELAEIGVKNMASNYFYEYFNMLVKDKELAELGVKNNAPEYFYRYFERLAINKELAKLGVQNEASEHFYKHFNMLVKDKELAELGVKNKAPEYFYKHFIGLSKDKELAEWGVKKKASTLFYFYFEKLKQDRELAKMGIEYEAPINFFTAFDILRQNRELAKWGVKNKVLRDFYDSFNDLMQDPSEINTISISDKKKKEFLRRFSILSEEE